MIAQLHAQGRRDPLLDLAIGGEAVGLGQALLELGQLLRRQGRGFAGGDIDIQEGVEATLGLPGEPAANGIARDAEELSSLAAAARLPSGQQIEQMEALPLTRIALVRETVLEVVGRLMDDRHGAVHGCSLVRRAGSRLYVQDTEILLGMQA